jgi:hypothetical protein
MSKYTDIDAAAVTRAIRALGLRVDNLERTAPPAGITQELGESVRSQEAQLLGTAQNVNAILDRIGRIERRMGISGGDDRSTDDPEPTYTEAEVREAIARAGFGVPLQNIVAHALVLYREGK